MLYNELRSQELGQAASKGAIVILPTGAVEQHGPCLPVDVDVRICYEVATRASERVREDLRALVLPPVSYGISSQHMGFPGTITLSAETFIHVVRDIGRSLVRHGFRRIMFLNGHGGNWDALKVTARMLRDEAAVRCVAARYWDFGREGILRRRETSMGGMAHACEMEHSCLLALRPDLVDHDSRRANIPQWKTRYVTQDLFDLGKVNFPYDVTEISATGIVGDPSSASAEKGREFLDFVVDGLEAFLREFATWDLEHITGWA